MIKTSDTHPLTINTVRLPHVKGMIGMTFCPGKKGPSLDSGSWDRDLGKDLAAIVDWGANALVSLVEDLEFELLMVPDFKEQVQKLNLEWFHFPIIDVSVPGERFERAWTHEGNKIRGILAKGGKVVLHCRGGLGRTGLLAARLLVEFGLEPEDAIKQVRASRPGAIETREQENHIFECKSRNARRTLDHYLGCLLGGAIGDALGAAVEFDTLLDIRKKYGVSGITSYDTVFGRAGAITDDTQMTLFTAEGLLRACTRANYKGISPSFASVTYQAYRRWLATQGELSEDGVHKDGWLIKNKELFSRRAPGSTCLSSLNAEDAFIYSNSNNSNKSKGCGAVMRSAPVGLFVQSPYIRKIWDAPMRDEQSYNIGRDLGYLTHGHPGGYLPAACLAKLIGRIIDGDDLDTALDRVMETLNGNHDAHETIVAICKARDLARDTMLEPCPETIAKIGEGWVGEEALAIAIYCALVAGDDFNFGMCLAVNHDGDSDSTGSIAGNILGALLGRKAIANDWLERLELRHVIEQVAIDLFLGFQDGDEWWDKYPGY